MRSAVVVYNPVSGRSAAEFASLEATRCLEEAGFQVERIATRDRAGARPVAQEVASHVDRLVIVGGDGSIREAIEGLGKARHHVPIGIVPQGNANVVAREFGIPKSVEAAARIAASGEARATDLGMAQGDTFKSLFLAVVGIGWDAYTVRTVDRVRHSRAGRIWYRSWADSVYLVSGMLEALRPGQSRFQLAVDGVGDDTSYCAAFLCNLRAYGKGLVVAPEAGPTTGRVHVHARRRASPAYLAWQLAAAHRGRRSPSFISDYTDGQHVEVQARGTAFPVEIDGDYFGRTHRLEVTALPAAVRILAP